MWVIITSKARISRPGSSRGPPASGTASKIPKKTVSNPLEFRHYLPLSASKQTSPRPYKSSDGFFLTSTSTKHTQKPISPFLFILFLLACRLTKASSRCTASTLFFLEVTFYFFDTTVTNHTFSNSNSKILDNFEIFGSILNFSENFDFFWNFFCFLIFFKFFIYVVNAALFYRSFFSYFLRLEVTKEHFHCCKIHS